MNKSKYNRMNKSKHKRHTFGTSGVLHRNCLIDVLEDEYAVTFRDYDIGSTTITAKTNRAARVLKRLFKDN